jgi:hypothetical protein
VVGTDKTASQAAPDPFLVRSWPVADSPFANSSPGDAQRKKYLFAF